MGILNITPDSFSDGGLYEKADAAVERGRELFREGAGIVDIGGESTAPGNVAVSAAEEIRRVLSAVTNLSRFGMVSVDTYKAETARVCLESGAKMVNDVSGLRGDPDMRAVVAEHGAWIVIMHSKESDDAPHASVSEKEYEDVAGEIANFLRRRADYALSGGIAEDKIILDPGMGRFLSHDPRYSWKLLAEFERLVELVKPFPILIGTSRKGFLGGKLAERDPISQLTAVAACMKGARIIRTHCPRMAKDFLEACNTLFPASLSAYGTSS